MTSITYILKGILIGIASIIPGVSGGTMAISFGIYDKIIGSVSNFFQDWKNSIITLFPVAIGCSVGLVGFTYAVEFLLNEHTFLTSMSFMGLILGGIPGVYHSLNAKKEANNSAFRLVDILVFILFFVFSIALPLMSEGKETLQVFTATPKTMISFFFVGIIASITMVIPGVSGTMVLMILGVYYGIFKSIKTFLDALTVLDFPVLLKEFYLLCPYTLGIVLGVFLIAKVITYLFEKHSVPTYCAILGLIISSPFAIFYNTGALQLLPTLSIRELLIGLLFSAFSALLTYKIGD